MHTRSAILLAIALALPGVPAVAQMSRAALVKQSDIIFIGTVTQVGAVAAPEVPASNRTVVVRVDQVLEKPAAVALATGDSVTVEAARPGSHDVAWVGTPKFAEGQEGTFLLHVDSTTGSPHTMIAGRSVLAYTALHKLDVLTTQDATRVKALIKKP